MARSNTKTNEVENTNETTESESVTETLQGSVASETPESVNTTPNPENATGDAPSASPGIREGATVAERLADYASVYVKIVAGIPAPIMQAYPTGHVCNELEAKALSSYRVERAASVANSALTRGKQKNLTDTGKVEYLTKYLGEYSFTASIGGDFDYNVLHLAVDRIVFALGVKQGRLSGAYEDHCTSDEREKRSKIVEKILNDASVVDKYTTQVGEEILAIFAERHAIKERASKDKDETDEIEI